MFRLNRGIKILLGILFCVSLILGIFTYLLTWNSTYMVPKTKVSAQLVDKMREVQKQGGKIGLDEKEINEIIGMYVKESKSFSGLTVKGIEAKVKDKYITLNIPAQYKGINIFVSSKGTLTMKDSKIQYNPEIISVGKIPISKQYILGKLKKSQNKKITIEQDKICFDKNLIPMSVTSLEVKDNNLALTINKVVNNLEEKLKAFNKKDEDNKNSGKSEASQENDKTNSNKINDNSTNEQSSSGYNSTKNKLSTSEMDAALERIASGLNQAMSSVSSGAQQSVVSEMISAANSMKGNPNANPYEYAGSARATYKNLSPQEKAELKSAVFSNVNGEDVNIVTNMLQ